MDEVGNETVVVQLYKEVSILYNGLDVSRALLLLFCRRDSRMQLEYMMQHQDCRITCIASTDTVNAFLLESTAFVMPYVVKTAHPDRLIDAAQQFAAESQAAAIFEAPNPLMGHPVRVATDASNGAFTISVYAGQSVDKLLAAGGDWAQLSKEERLDKSALVAAGIMMARQLLDTVPDELGGPRMHRDIKLGNMCVRGEEGGDVPVLMDYGGFCRQTKGDYHGVISLNALDPLLATLHPSGRYAAAEDAEGARQMTDHTLDVAQTALCVVQIVAGSLPAAVDPAQYDLSIESSTQDHASSGNSKVPAQPDRSAFFKAVREFDWTAWAEQQALPKDARDFVLWCLSADPRNRPQTGAEALTHPFLAAAADKVRLAAESAADRWEQAHLHLRMLLSDVVWLDVMCNAVEAAIGKDSHKEEATHSSCGPDSSSTPLSSSMGTGCVPATPLVASRSCSTAGALMTDSNRSSHSGSTTNNHACSCIASNSGMTAQLPGGLGLSIAVSVGKCSSPSATQCPLAAVLSLASTDAAKQDVGGPGEPVQPQHAQQSVDTTHIPLLAGAACKLKQEAGAALTVISQSIQEAAMQEC